MMEAEVFVLLVIGLALLGTAITVLVHDIGRQREQRAREIQARLTAALILEPALSAFAITPTVRLARWPRAPLLVDIAGVVPTGQHRDAALQLVRREASGAGEVLHVGNHLLVDSRPFARAA
jgi:hypothetical protein